MRQKIIVSGGFGALGRCVADSLRLANCDVARLDLAPSPAWQGEAFLDMGGVDLNDEAATALAVEKVADAFGGIDGIVNIAGGFRWETMEGGSIGTWREMFATNLLSAVTLTSAALPYLRASSRGRVVNLGAGAALKGDAGMGAYAASKAGVHKMTECLAAELSGTSVTVNAILPTIIDTPANRADMPDADFGSWVALDALADIVRFLMSDQARALNGALLFAGRGS